MKKDPNIVEFPKNKVVRDVTEEQLKERTLRHNEKLADTIVEEITGMMIAELDNFLIDVQDKKLSKDLVLVVDSLKAAVYRHLGLEHHLHDFIDKNVKLIDGASKMSKEELQETIQMIIAEIESEIDNEEKE